MLYPVLAAFILVAGVAVCESASLDGMFSRDGLSLDLDLGQKQHQQQQQQQQEEKIERVEKVEKPKRRYTYEPVQESRHEESRREDHGRKKFRFLAKNKKKDRSEDDDESSLLDCEDLYCAFEWALQYWVDTISYPVRRLTVD